MQNAGSKQLFSPDLDPAKTDVDPDPAKTDLDPDPAKTDLDPDPAKTDVDLDPAKTDVDPDPAKTDLDRPSLDWRQTGDILSQYYNTKMWEEISVADPHLLLCGSGS